MQARNRKAEAIALIGALAFIMWIPFYSGVLKVNAQSPIAVAVSNIPIVNDIVVSLTEREGLMMFAIFMVACLLGFIWAVKKQSKG